MKESLDLLAPRCNTASVTTLDLLDADQRAAFARDGYLIVPGVVGQRAVDVALQVANHWLDEEFDSRRRDAYHGFTFAPEHAADPEFLGLLTESGALQYAESLVGQPLVRPQRSQIAIRFPVALGQDPGMFGAHLDGIPAPLNRVATDGKIHNFTLLAGVFLSDCPMGDHGNFTMWPGTHVETARWLRAHGTDVSDPDAFFAAIRELADRTSQPMQLEVRAGDLVLAHYLLLHSAGRHAGPNIRYAVFFRLETPHHADVADAALTEPWLDWPAFNDTQV